jgi:succinate dehydrogenase (ubiquinone) cytochrome b560 subunit
MLARNIIAATKRSAVFTPRLGLGLSSVRNIVTVKATSAEENSILVAQRKNRPVSPHLEIYQLQLTWVLSGLHRITGVGLAAGLYAVTASYAFGIVDTASLIALFTSLPAAVKVGLKTLAAFPFAFHAWNGIRHLLWDYGIQANIKGVYKTGYAVLGLSAITGLALLLL